MEESRTVGSGRTRETVCSRAHHSRSCVAVKCWTRIYLRQALRLTPFSDLFPGNNPISFSDPFGLQTGVASPTVTTPGAPSPQAVEGVLQSIERAEQAAQSAQRAAQVAETTETAVGRTALVLGLLYLNLALAEHDYNEGKKVCQSYGWCNTPLPGPDAPPLRVAASQGAVQHLKAQPLAGRSCKKGDSDDCTKRSHDEVNWCAASFKDWSPELYRLCVAR